MCVCALVDVRVRARVCVQRGRPKGDGVVKYEDPMAAQAAPGFFDGHELKGKKMKVEMAEVKPASEYANRGGEGARARARTHMRSRTRHIRARASTHTQTHAHAHARTHTRAHAHTQTHTRTRTHTHTHTRAHARTHTHTSSR